MAAVNHGRMTHDHDGELVVFMIGMTINQWWRPDLWLPVFRAMPPMLMELSKDAESGMIGSKLILDPAGPWLVQYWTSLDKLYSYAADRDREHRPAWAAYNRRARKATGAVGIWHETYLTKRAESMYVSTPPLGLGKATKLRPATGRLTEARARMAAGSTG